jgi:hypothetical protein
MLRKKLQKKGKRIPRMPDPLEERIKEAAQETKIKMDYRDHEIPPKTGKYLRYKDENRSCGQLFTPSPVSLRWLRTINIRENREFKDSSDEEFEQYRQLREP